ncbi:hypothetical protein CGC21_1820 [Leishmania donovani]|uniref:CFA20 domain-containing protein n=1 Tax=Leishmania donovani TaxID=5661 RepID=A0A504XFE9_LEIDO|nr:hypothetical protein CGC21_1820 [Leishmania donovani]
MATELQLVMEANSELLAHAKVANPRGCSIHVDKHIQKPVLIMKGTPSQTRVQVPREDRPLSSLRLHNSLLAAQICLNSTDHFAVEIVVSQYTVKRTKLIIGTNVAAARYDKTDDELTTAYLPLIIPRNKWVQVVFHVAGIVHTVFNLPCITCIDAITLTGTGKISCVFTSSDEQSCIAATPEGMALFAVPAYVPPIWKTAAATPEHLSSLLNIDSRSDIPFTSDVSFGTAAAPCAESPSSPASPLSTHSVILPRLKLLKETAVPPSYPHVSSSASEQVGAALGKGSYSAPSQCDYIRLVDNEDIVAKDEHSTISCSYGDGHRQQASQDTVAGRSCGAARGAANSTACGLSGWEQFPEERHRVMPRQGSLNSGGDDGRSNISRRQQRLRRRMRVLRANEQKANKTAAAKALVASELPLSQRVAAVEDSTEAAPICGYGFGYLGVLKPNGEYEEDDDANLNLEGALTLLTDNE